MRQQATEVNLRKERPAAPKQVPSSQGASRTSQAATVDAKLRSELNVVTKSKEADSERLRSRNNSLENLLRSKEGEIKKLREQLSYSTQASKEVIGQKNQELELMHVRYSSLLQSHQSQETNVKNLTSSLSAVEGQLRDANWSWEKTQSELSNCRDELFRMQPLAQVPDSEILHDFETLCQNISNWIDEEISNYESSHPEASPNQIYSDGGNANLLELLNTFPEAGEHFVRYHVHYHLCQKILRSDLQLLGLTTAVEEAIQSAEESMHHLTPARGNQIPII